MPSLSSPYPSGAGLHVGHCRPYTAMDIIARKKRMEGKTFSFPLGMTRSACRRRTMPLKITSIPGS